MNLFFPNRKIALPGISILKAKEYLINVKIYQIRNIDGRG